MGCEMRARRAVKADRWKRREGENDAGPVRVLVPAAELTPAPQGTGVPPRRSCWRSSTDDLRPSCEQHGPRERPQSCWMPWDMSGRR
jgi:hypothetical protein